MTHCIFCGLIPGKGQEVCITKRESDRCPESSDTLASGPFKGLKRKGYRVLYVDPPWQFKTRSDAGKGRSPEMHYPCQSLDDLKALPVADLAAPDCALFLWVIDTHIEQALELAKAWGFEYKTRAFCWAKLQAKIDPVIPAGDETAYFTGMGYWTRANPEDCWLLTKGAPNRAGQSGPAASVKRLVVTPRREHSRKPDEIIERIETLIEGPYVELFARQSRPGWDCWGNETGKFNPPPMRRARALL